jgi:hypothetical protein
VKAQQYPFINYDQSKLRFGKDSSQFMDFYKKIDELREGKRKKVTVVHFGGSHVQADIWTSRLRDNFNQFINQKQAARGWIYPFKMGLKNNNPSNYQIDYKGKWDGCRAVNYNCYGNIGLNALQTTTYDSSSAFSIQLFESNRIDYVFDRVKVFYQQSENSFDLELDSNYTAKQIIVDKQNYI